MQLGSHHLWLQELSSAKELYVNLYLILFNKCWIRIRSSLKKIATRDWFQSTNSVWDQSTEAWTWLKNYITLDLIQVGLDSNNQIDSSVTQLYKNNLNPWLKLRVDFNWTKLSLGVAQAQIKFMIFCSTLNSFELVYNVSGEQLTWEQCHQKSKWCHEWDKQYHWIDKQTNLELIYRSGVLTQC